MSEVSGTGEKLMHTETWLEDVTIREHFEDRAIDGRCTKRIAEKKATTA
jgi:hypothetical protein